MPWIVYETKNKINGKIYVGVHKQDGDEFDGYLGSGKSLAAAIRKYGKDNFERRTMFSFDNERDAYAREAEIVTEEWCKRTDNYNVSVGGFGAFWAHDKAVVERHSSSMKEMWKSSEYREMQASIRGTEDFRKRHSIAVRASCRARRPHECSPLLRAKRSASAKRMWASDEFRAKQSASRAAGSGGRSRSSHQKPRSQETRKKQAAAARSMWGRPEYRAKQRASLAASRAKPDYRASQSAKMKTAWGRRRIAKANALLTIL